MRFDSTFDMHEAHRRLVLGQRMKIIKAVSGYSAGGLAAPTDM